MKEHLQSNIREAKIDIAHLLDEYLYIRYRCNLDSTIEGFDEYEDVSSETREDLRVLNSQIELLAVMGLLERGEADAILKEAAQLRMDKLEGLEASHE